MEMYWGGYGGTAVAQHFNIPVGTVYSWIHDFGNQKERKAVIKPLMEQFRAASDTGEWLGALRGNTLACNTCHACFLGLAIGYDFMCSPNMGNGGSMGFPFPKGT
jgi:hypothetical protein